MNLRYLDFPYRAAESRRRGRVVYVPASPVAFANRLFAAGGYRMHDYQAESILCPALRKCHCDGRDVGKTTEIAVTHLHYALTVAGTSSLICAQWQHNLAPTLERLVSICAQHPVIAPLVKRIVRSPFYRIEFNNGSLLLGKIAGNHGVNFQNTHVDLISVDEAQNLLDVSWNELFPALNAGGRLHLYGVPNGVRNRFYQMTFDAGFAQFRWASAKNPAFTPEKDEELARLYGGRESEGYVHNVLGEHGAPSASAFDLARVEACTRAGKELHLVCEGAGSALDLAPFVAVARGRRILLGADIGYTRDPTIFVIWAFEGDAIEALRCETLGIVELRRVAYARQAAILAELADAMHAEAIAADRGGGGLAVLQALVSLRPDLLARIVRGQDLELGISFNEALVLAANGERQRQKMKVAVTDLYLRLIAEGRVTFGCSERIDQMMHQTYRLTERGDVVYSKGNDHILDADRTVLYALLTRFQSATTMSFRPAVLADV